MNLKKDNKNFRFYDQLQIPIDVTNLADQQQLTDLFHNYIYYPSSELADVHLESNRLGLANIRCDRSPEQPPTLQRLEMYNQQVRICHCCGLLKQPSLAGKSLQWYTTPLYDIMNLGESNRIHFLNLVYSSIMMLVTFIVYGIYSISVNIVYNSDCWQHRLCGISGISSGTKIVLGLGGLYTGSSAFGWFTVLIWMLGFIYKSKLERTIEIAQAEEEPTISQFSVLIYNLPVDTTKESLQQALNKYSQQISQHLVLPDRYEEAYDKKFTIASFNECRNLCQALSHERQRPRSAAETSYAELKSEVAAWIRKRQSNIIFYKNAPRRAKILDELNKLVPKVEEANMEAVRRVSKDYIQTTKNQSTKTVFVTFEHNYAQINLLKFNHRSWWDLVYHGWNHDSEFTIGNQKLKIRRAPEPQQMLWHNINPSYCYSIVKRTPHYLVLLVFLAVSLGVQVLIGNQSGNNKHLSILTAIVIILFNLMSISIYIMYSDIIKHSINFEYHLHRPANQYHMTLWIVITQVINSIVFPIVSSCYSKNNVFQQGGLVDDVFYLMLFNGTLMPILKIFDYEYFLLKAKQIYYKQPFNKLYFESQKQYNQLFTLSQFQIGQASCYIATTIILACFYMSLQPIVLMFSSFGLALMYFVDKYILLFRSRIPLPSSNIFSKKLNKIFYFSVIAYAFGDLTWSIFIYNNVFNGALYRSVLGLDICVLLFGVILYVLPIDEIRDRFLSLNHPSSFYSQERIFLPSEYDRMNPYTRYESTKQFIKYLKSNRTELQQIYSQHNQLVLPLFMLHESILTQTELQFIRQDILLKSYPYDVLNQSDLRCNQQSLWIKKNKPKLLYSDTSTKSESPMVVRRVNQISSKTQLYSQLFIRSQQMDQTEMY